MASVGMMEGAYFVGRSELLAWANGMLNNKASGGSGGVALTKVEQFASGEHYCRLLAAAHPRGGSAVRLDKVNSKAVTEADFIKNYKELQRAFDKLQIDKHIPVARLVKGRALDNLEFLQWIKHYSDTIAGSAPPAVSKANGNATGSGGGGSIGSSSAPTPTASATKSQAGGRDQVARKSAIGREPASAAASGAVPVVAAPQAARLERELAEIKMRYRNMEQEREFYFRKLRDIEKLLGDYPDRNDTTDGDVLMNDHTNAGVTAAAQVARAVQYILFAEDDITPLEEATRILNGGMHIEESGAYDTDNDVSANGESGLEEQEPKREQFGCGDGYADDQEGGLCAEAALFAESLAASSGGSGGCEASGSAIGGTV